MNPQARTARALTGRRSRFSEFALETLIRVLGFSTIGFVGLIFLFLLREGVPVFFEVSARRPVLLPLVPDVRHLRHAAADHGFAPRHASFP